MNLDLGAFTEVLVVGTFVGILKPAPAADIVYQDRPEVRSARFNVLNKFLQGIPALQRQAALASISVGTDDLHAMRARILGDNIGLVFSGVLLMFSGHSDVLYRPNRHWRVLWTMIRHSSVRVAKGVL